MKQQLILPCIPMGATEIKKRVGVFRKNNHCTYFLGGYPVYSHEADDQRMFRVVTSQLIESGSCRQIEILRTFGVSKRESEKNRGEYNWSIIISALSKEKIDGRAVMSAPTMLPSHRV